jgi:hypothetical protein
MLRLQAAFARRQPAVAAIVSMRVPALRLELCHCKLAIAIASRKGVYGCAAQTANPSSQVLSMLVKMSTHGCAEVSVSTAVHTQHRELTCAVFGVVAALAWVGLYGSLQQHQGI